MGSDVSDVEVDDVVCVGALYADREGVSRMEGERYQSAGRRRRTLAQHTCVDAELEQPGISRVESANKLNL